MKAIPQSVLLKRSSRFKVVKHAEDRFAKIYARPLSHRLAVLERDGLVEYYKDSKCTILHNLNGPAIFECWNKQYYFIDGVRLTYRKWFAASNALKKQARKIINDKQAAKDKILSDKMVNKTARFYQSFLNQLPKKRNKIQ